jgi:transposase
MHHHNSVFHGVLKHVPWAEFDRLVDEHRADHRVRRLTTRSQFVAMLYGQLAGAASLREIVTGLESQAARLYHLGARPAQRSTLSDANATRPSAMFGDLFAGMVAWANVTDSTSGMKLHVIHDPDSDRPVYAAFSAANVNDITMAQQMPVEPGATYVFDLGYYDFGWWAKLDRAGCRIVTRFKSNTPLSVVKELPIPQASAVLSDRIGHLPQRQARSRTNPFLDPVREVRIKTETGKVLRILCNDLDADAEEIAALYKRRWAVELFFRWVKQTLRITRFFGTSENAVRIQIIVALIAYLLLRMAHAAQRSVQSPLDFARLVRLNLMHRRSINALLEPHQPMTRLANQLALAFHA